MGGHLLPDAVGHDDGGDEAVYGEDLGHDGAEAALVSNMMCRRDAAAGNCTYVFCIKRSGRSTPHEKMAMDDLAVP